MRTVTIELNKKMPGVWIFPEERFRVRCCPQYSQLLDPEHSDRDKEISGGAHKFRGRSTALVFTGIQKANLRIKETNAKDRQGIQDILARGHPGMHRSAMKAQWTQKETQAVVHAWK